MDGCESDADKYFFSPIAAGPYISLFSHFPTYADNYGRMSIWKSTVNDTVDDWIMRRRSA